MRSFDTNPSRAYSRQKIVLRELQDPRIIGRSNPAELRRGRGRRWLPEIDVGRMPSEAAALVNELVEAKQNNQVRRLMIRWQRYELIALDEGLGVYSTVLGS